MPQTQFALSGLNDSIRLISFDIPEPPKEVEPPKKKVATVQYTTPVIVAKTETTPPEIKDLDKDVRIGNENIEGEPASQAGTKENGEGDNTEIGRASCRERV